MLILPAQAQDRVTVSGRLTDTGQNPLIGASVIERGTTNGVTTDVDGRYQISVAKNATLDFSFVGYKTQSVAVANRTQIDVTLEEDAMMIGEVVAIGYGSQRKEDLSMAVTTVKVDEGARSRAADLGTLLQGRMPGVTILQSGGDPMRKASFSIRGRGSKGNDDDPTSGDGVLVVVDGVPYAPLLGRGRRNGDGPEGCGIGGHLRCVGRIERRHPDHHPEGRGGQDARERECRDRCPEGDESAEHAQCPAILRRMGQGRRQLGERIAAQSGQSGGVRRCGRDPYRLARRDFPDGHDAALRHLAQRRNGEDFVDSFGDLRQEGGYDHEYLERIAGRKTPYGPPADQMAEGFGACFVRIPGRTGQSQPLPHRTYSGRHVVPLVGFGV